MSAALLILLGITGLSGTESIAITHGADKSLFACIKALKQSVEMSRMAWHPRGESKIPRKAQDQERMEIDARAALDAVDEACGVGEEGE